jgi:serine protease Do
VEVQGQKVKTPEDAAKRVEADVKAGRKTELLLINRDGDLRYVGLRMN